MKRLVFALLFFPISQLAACGFQPLYSQNNQSLGAVKILPIDGRIGHFIEEKLGDRFSLNAPNGPDAILETKINSEFQYTSLAANSYTKRTVLKVTANYSLSIEGGAPIKGTIVTDIGYDTSVTAFADIALLADAEERAGAELANRIWFDIQHQLALKQK